jgi:hypothetical protein
MKNVKLTIISKFLVLGICSHLSLVFSQPVALTTVIGPSDMELKLIQEQERSESLEKVSLDATKLTQESETLKPETNNPTVNIIANNQAGVSALQFDNLPKIVSEIVSNFEGNFETKNQQKKQNEELCSQKLNEMKLLVESQLKRSVYKVECSEPEFHRIDGQKMQFTSKATITFF